MIIGIVVIVVVVLLVLWYISSYNGLVSLKNKSEEAFSTMDVFLKKRFDMIPNLVNTVKGYSKHEAETLEKVVAARNSGATISEKIEGEKQLSGALRQVFALAESYPELKANENYMTLMNQLQAVENDIANARKYYNGAVRQYNDKVMMVPSNIVASLAHFEKLPMYEVSDSVERENVKVEF